MPESDPTDKPPAATATPAAAQSRTRATQPTPAASEPKAAVAESAAAASKTAAPGVGEGARATGRPIVVTPPPGRQPVMTPGLARSASALDPNTGRPSERRKVMLSLLRSCLDKSRVREVVAMDTLAYVINKSVATLWRGDGEFEIESLWRILSNEPGLTPQEAAAPLLIFSTFEGEIGVAIKLPPELAAIPIATRLALRARTGLGTEEVERAVARIEAIATEETIARDKAKAVAAASAEAPSAPKKTQPPGPKLVKSVVATAVAAALVGTVLWITLGDGTAGLDVDDVGDLVKLSNARRAGTAMVAQVVDPKWGQLAKPAKRALAKQLLTRESPKGIEIINLTDGAQHTVAYVTAAGGIANLQITIP